MPRTLDSGSNAFLLQAQDVLSRQLSSEEWILGERLKIPASQWVTVHADRWSKQDMSRSRLDLVGKVLANLIQ